MLCLNIETDATAHIFHFFSMANYLEIFEEEKCFFFFFSSIMFSANKR